MLRQAGLVKHWECLAFTCGSPWYADCCVVFGATPKPMLKLSKSMQHFLVLTVALLIAGEQGAVASVEKSTKVSRRRTKRSIERVYSPNWADPKICQNSPNQSFLVDTDQSVDFSDPLLSGKMVTDKKALSFRQQFELANQGYELRRSQGQSNFQTEISYRDQMNQLGGSFFDEVKNAQIRDRFWDEKTQAKVRRGAKEAAEGSLLKKPVAVLATMAAISTGQPLEVELEQDMSFFARTDVRTKSGELRLMTPLVNTKVGYATTQNERYSLSMGRSLPVWNLHSDVTYGGSSNLVSASLSKELLENLVCRLNSSRATTTNRIDSSLPAEESLSVNYQVRF